MIKGRERDFPKMTLQEAEAKLSEINDKINELLKKREMVLREMEYCIQHRKPG